MKKGQSLSAGRVQSVVNKLILERENLISSIENNFKTIFENLGYIDKTI